MNDSLEHSERVIVRHSKSFALASRLLPESSRRDAAATYAWCRHADDAIDHCDGDASEALRHLEGELEAIYGRAYLSDETLLSFREVTRRWQVPIQYPRALLRGMRMDVEGVCYPTLAALKPYCFRVAGTVGLMMCHVLGVRDRVALCHAAWLGMAMQLTNICRDVAEDWQRGRLYLPLDWLRRRGAPSSALTAEGELDREASRAMRPVVQKLLDVAESWYRIGDRGLVYLAPRAAFSIRVARHVYSAIGDEIRAAGCDVLAGRASVSGRRKLMYCGWAAGETFLSRSCWRPFERVRLDDSVQHVGSIFPL